MEIYFTTDYNSVPGETVFVTLYQEKEFLLSFQLDYQKGNTWQRSISLDPKTIQKKIRYQISVCNELSPDNSIVLYSENISLKKIKYNSIEIINRKTTTDYVIDVRKSKPFKKVFRSVNTNS